MIYSLWEENIFSPTIANVGRSEEKRWMSINSDAYSIERDFHGNKVVTNGKLLYSRE